jgi:hypothetical protein
LKQAFYISVEGGMNIGVNLFGPRKPHNEEVEMYVREWLPLQGPDLYREGFFLNTSVWDKCFNVSGELC